MTIEVQVQWVDDASVDNEVFRLDRIDDDELAPTGAVIWFVRGERKRAAHLLSAEAAIRAVRRRLPTYELYLLAAHTAVQEDTRVSQYRKLWRSLAGRGVSVVGRDLGENSLPWGTGMRCFGLRSLTESDVSATVAILEEEAASQLVAIPSDHESVLMQAIERGWSPPRRHPSIDLISQVLAPGGILLWPFGNFDDRECGIVAFAQPRVVAALVQPTTNLEPIA